MEKFGNPGEIKFDEAEHRLKNGISRDIYLLEQDVKRLEEFVESGKEFDKDEEGSDNPTLKIYEIKEEIERLEVFKDFWARFIDRVINWNPETDLDPEAKTFLKEFLQNDPQKTKELLEEIIRIAEIMRLEDIKKEDSMRALSLLRKALSLFRDDKIVIDGSVAYALEKAQEAVSNNLEKIRNNQI